MQTTMDIGSRVKFTYLDDGKKTEDSGYVCQDYPNGQFVISDYPDKIANPRRFDAIAVTFA